VTGNAVLLLLLLLLMLMTCPSSKAKSTAAKCYARGRFQWRSLGRSVGPRFYRIFRVPISPVSWLAVVLYTVVVTAARLLALKSFRLAGWAATSTRNTNGRRHISRTNHEEPLGKPVGWNINSTRFNLLHICCATGCAICKKL